MDPEERLNQYLQMPSETEWLEFKEAKNNFDFERLGEYFSAISNEANLKHQSSGWIIFGVSPSRKIVGIQYRKNLVDLNSLKHEIAKQTNGLTFHEIHELNRPEGRILMFQIPPAPPGIPTSWKGHYYGRDGESLSSLSMQEIETIRYQMEALDWSAQIFRSKIPQLSHIQKIDILINPCASLSVTNKFRLLKSKNKSKLQSFTNKNTNKFFSSHS